MQLRLTVLGPRSGHALRSCDVLVTAPAGTALAAVASGLAAAVAAAPGPGAPPETGGAVRPGRGAARGAGAEAPGAGHGSGPVILYAGSERLDSRRCVLGEPPLVDGTVLSLGAPVEPGGHPGVAQEAAEEAAARLHVVAGPDAGGVHLLHGGQVRIGRSADADVPLDDPDVSRLHCSVTVTDDGLVTVADLGSTNGTELDGARIDAAPRPLRPGALLRIGESALRLEPATEHPSPHGPAPQGSAPGPGVGGPVRAGGPRRFSVFPGALPAAADGEGHLRIALPADAAGPGGAGSPGPAGTGPGSYGPRADDPRTGGAAVVPGQGGPWSRAAPAAFRRDDGFGHGPDPARTGGGTPGGLPPDADEWARVVPGRRPGSGDLPRYGPGAAAPGEQYPVPRQRTTSGPGEGSYPPGRPAGPTRAGDGPSTFLGAGPAAGEPGRRQPTPLRGSEVPGDLGPAGDPPGAESPREHSRTDDRREQHPGPEDESASRRTGRRGRGIGAWARRLAGGRPEEQSDPAGADPGTPAGPSAAAEAAALHRRWPDPSHILLTALGPGSRLWERGPGHPDALVVRLGTADRPGVPGAPVTVGLRQAGSLGLAGPRARLSGLARSVVAQLAALHSPAVLEIVLISTDDTRGVTERMSEWAWLGWLPQLRPAHGQDCRLLLAYDREQAVARIAELTRRLDDRPRTAPVAGGAARRHDGPYTVLIVDGDPGSDALREATARLASAGPAAGVHLVCLAETPAASPTAPLFANFETARAVSPAFGECGAVAMLGGDVATALRLIHLPAHGPGATGPAHHDGAGADPGGSVTLPHLPLPRPGTPLPAGPAGPDARTTQAAPGGFGPPPVDGPAAPDDGAPQPAAGRPGVPGTRPSRDRAEDPYSTLPPGQRAAGGGNRTRYAYDQADAPDAYGTPPHGTTSPGSGPPGRTGAAPGEPGPRPYRSGSDTHVTHGLSAGRAAAHGTPPSGMSGPSAAFPAASASPSPSAHASASASASASAYTYGPASSDPAHHPASPGAAYDSASAASYYDDPASPGHGPTPPGRYGPAPAGGAGATRPGVVDNGTAAVVDAVSAAWAERFARSLAPLRTTDAGTGGPGNSRRVAATLPRAARLLDDLGLARATPASLTARWAAAADAGQPAGGRACAVLGAGPHGPLAVDLAAEGPHLLIDGGTGTGKTELLRSLAASLAAADRPDRLSLVLVDGGGMRSPMPGRSTDGLQACTDLPHVSTYLAGVDPVRMRAFAQALSSELKRRAELLGDLDFVAWHARQAELTAQAAVRRPSERSGGDRPNGDLESESSGTLKLRVRRGDRSPDNGAAPGTAPGGAPVPGQGSERPGCEAATGAGGPGGAGAGTSAGAGTATGPAALPRLAVLVDDFDALISPALGSTGRPAAGSVVRALEAVARHGARLGVHLIAATGHPDRTAGTAAAEVAGLRVTLEVLPAITDGPERAEATAGRGRLSEPDGTVTPFQAGRVTGRIPRTATQRPTVVPLDWERMGDPPTRRPLRELGNGPTDLALLASALQRAAQSAPAVPAPPLVP